MKELEGGKMWRPEGWDAEAIVVGTYQELTIESIAEKERNLVEAGADAMLRAIWQLAAESPTGTFTMDSRSVNIFRLRVAEFPQ